MSVNSATGPPSSGSDGDDPLGQLIKAVEEQVNDARASLDRATERKLAAKEKERATRQAYLDAEAEEKSAGDNFTRLEEARDALRGRPKRLLSTSQRKSNDELVEVAFKVLQKNPSGLEKDALWRELLGLVEGKKTGLHKKLPALFEALKEDSRFTFDGRVWSLSNWAPSAAPVS